MPIPALVLAAALATAPCDAPEARQFDFWIGSWEIEQKIRTAAGEWLTLPARNSVERVLGGCGLLERWDGRVQFFWEGMKEPEPMQGLSLRWWDPETGKWWIEWMDDRAPVAPSRFSGGFAGGRGEFFRTSTGPRGETLNRITFADTDEGAFRWELAVSSDAGATWTPLWTMSGTRRAATSPRADDRAPAPKTPGP